MLGGTAVRSLAMSKLRWAVLGTGMIAKAFAAGLQKSETGVLSMTGSRSPEKGQAFAQEYGGSSGSYAEAVQSDQVDAVYNALPHHLHEEWTIKTAEAGKAVLCEKPFTLDAPSAERALAAVKKHGVFFMEAFMYRCHPQVAQIKEAVAQGRIGRPLHVQADFGFAAAYPWENFRSVNAYGGGALMDVGCYCVSFAILIAQEPALRAHYAYQPTPERYDRIGSGILEFPSGITASFSTAVHHNLRNQAEVWGDEGKIVVTSPWFGNGGEVQIWNSAGTELVETLPQLTVENIYGNEADVVAAHLSQGEAPAMPIDHTLWIMQALDELRASSGFMFDAIQEEGQ